MTILHISRLPRLYLSRPSFRPNVVSKRIPTLLGLARHYHDDGVYGYRVPRVFSLPDYTPEELANRSENSNLVRLVSAYRSYGHRGAYLDPLDLMQREEATDLDPARYGLTDMNKSYNLAGILHVNESRENKESRNDATLSTIVEHLKKTYCGKIAYEFMHIPNASERRWFARRVESFEKRQLSHEDKKRIFEILTKSEVFDHFMAKKFTQVKRYGLEGAESMMVALDQLFALSSSSGIREVVLCMPHRGRLNLLTGLLQYPPTALFHKVKGNSEFSEELIAAGATGDVLSHIANSPKLNYGSKSVKVTLLPNPSHLEAVNPVAMGKARAKQMDMMKFETECELGDKVMCVQLHGDASFTGQGVVMESLGISNLPHFSSGGSLHIVVNNQLGYTTPAQNARSTVYCSDVGKMINAPVIHVNGDFPEDVISAISLAFEYRDKFRKDVILDLITYRRWGHNELDEPAYTQPLMYRNIRSRKSVPNAYEEKLLNEGVLTSTDEVNAFRQQYFDVLNDQLQKAASFQPETEQLRGKWKDMRIPSETVSVVETGVPTDQLVHVGKASVQVPSDISLHPRLQKYHVQARLSRIAEGQRIDWATAESLAFGSLMQEGYNVRISGQDVGRGTFSQRHAMLVCQDTERVVVPLNNNLGEGQGSLEVANSNLSELAVLSFEYGMSWETPNTLCIWEAQFGDFFNGAQVVIDTYISSSEAKWNRQSGIVMLLPHGYDGAGPEHSSCRVERFLQLCNDRFDASDIGRANVNMHVVNCTTPAQYFHALRRQMKRDFRKPLIVVSPKALLRSPVAVSNLEDMAPGTSFQPVIGDNINAFNVRKVVFVSGKLYYDLVKERQARGMEDQVALVRVEELCPFPAQGLAAEIERYQNAEEFVWCQEESQNSGAYTFMAPRLEKLLPSGYKLDYVGRGPSAAPAVGIAVIHRKEVASIYDNCFA
ncbi:uncharacterized protein VTP21DRAFT_11086 [Calcarisporiella thermophila]|uniref:uncharacterized protein n=1 Tax=Calcarisporiella thermophila TaxID=911321 RepID=UPI0037427B7F